MSLRLPMSRRNKPSAIGLRQILPVQTNRTLFTGSVRAHERTFNLSLNANKVNPGNDSQPDGKALDAARARGLEENPLSDRMAWIVAPVEDDPAIVAQGV